MRIKLKFLYIFSIIFLIASCSKDDSDKTDLEQEDPEVITVICNLTAQIEYDSIGTLTAIADGGTAPFAYAWSNGATAQVSRITDSGTYSVTITDSEGCTAEATIEIFLTGSDPCDALSVRIDVDGSDLTAYAAGGTEPYAYVWSTAETTKTIIVSENGTYNVTVTDADGCAETAEVSVGIVVDVPCDSMTVILEVDGFDLTATVLDGTPPYAYRWSNGDTGATTSVNTPGVYELYVEDVNGCTAYGSVEVTDGSTPLDIRIDVDGFILTAYATGGVPPYTYLWSTGETTSTIRVNSVGDYSIQVYDAAGNFVNGEVTVVNDNCVFEQNDSDMDGLIDDEERRIMNDCMQNAISSKSELESNLDGLWELVGHGEGWLPTISQPCSSISIDSSTLIFKYTNASLDVETTHRWYIEDQSGNLELIIDPPLEGYIFLNFFCEEYMYGDATPSDGQMHIYQKM